MKFNSIAVSAFALTVQGLKIQEYPEYRLDSQTYPLHKDGEPIPISCIKRQIDTGEHMFDPETNEIIYETFPKCLETNKPFQLEFGLNSLKECTVQMDDELFHMFQLYLHKDVPWTCRLESKKDSGVYIPMDIAIRGNVMESHVDLDSNINMIIITENDDNDQGEIIAGTAWSSSRNTSKVIIGDQVKLRFNLNWSNQLKGSTINNVDKEAVPLDNGDLIEKSIKVFWLGELRNKSIFDSMINIFGFFIITLSLGALFGVIASYKRLGQKIQATNNDWMNKVE